MRYSGGYGVHLFASVESQFRYVPTEWSMVSVQLELSVVTKRFRFFQRVRARVVILLRASQ